MRKIEKLFGTVVFLLSLFILSSGIAAANPSDDEEETPDVTARVARVSFLRGAAQIRHSGDEDWERVTQNLPIVEGDEISTDADARLEIQFNRDNYLRLSENAYLKITTLRDEGIAVSLPEGNLSLRVLNFDADQTSFEIDAPDTTVAVQKAGMYRVDAGGKNNSQVRVSVNYGGQARIYSENSGFTLRSGRSAQIETAGNYAGEWETADSLKYTDEFDAWTLQRDEVIAKRLQNAYYGKYYDSDVYGAEDLSEYGDWIYTKKYGYVWKPYRTATNGYADWSPYRYGQWRFVPPYGWTWVNDEPWGYATYHHGRWIYVDNEWAWTPNGQIRTRRNWWRPALVVVGYSGNLICWYPLPYNYGYYDYNSYYVDRRRRNTTIINNTTVIVNQPPANNKNRRILNGLPIELAVPPTGVVAVESTDFGRGVKGARSVSTETAKKVLAKTPFETEAPALPNYRELKGKLNREIAGVNPRNEQVGMSVKTGATERKAGVPVDENMRKARVFGNRQPIERVQTEVTAGENKEKSGIRETGAVNREIRPTPRQNDDTEFNKSRTREISPDDFPIRSKNKNGNVEDNDNSSSKSRNRVKEISAPSYTPPERQPERKERKERRELPVQQESPRYEPPPKQREETRESKPPQREQPAPKQERKVEAPPEKSDTGRPEKIKPEKDNRK